jgi:uncharacterized protein (DUF983 family)
MKTFVNRYTRAGINGRHIECPVCGDGRQVYHFSWSAITCKKCDQMIDKYRWLTEIRGGK